MDKHVLTLLSHELVVVPTPISKTPVRTAVTIPPMSPPVME